MVYLYNGKQLSSKKDKQLLHVTAWTDHTSIVLNKINQTQKGIYYMIPFDKVQKLKQLVCYNRNQNRDDLNQGLS